MPEILSEYVACERECERLRADNERLAAENATLRRVPIGAIARLYNSARLTGAMRLHLDDLTNVGAWLAAVESPGLHPGKGE